MSKWTKLLIFIILSSAPQIGFSQENEDKPYSAWLNLGIGLNAFSSGILSDSSLNFQPEVGAAYYFAPNVGVFTGLGYTQYSIEDLGSKLEVSFIDVPIGLSFRYDNRFIEGAKSIFNLGLFFGLPVSDFEIDGSKLADAENPIGLYIGGLTTFAVSQDLRLGFGSTIKFPFGDLVDTPDNDGLSVAFNFVVQY